MHSQSYYPHIDSLRAFAVLAVVIFHINHDYLKGGFVGVDIFFVISGFLITDQILRAVKDNRFSFKNFYSRRIRRILPAALSVIVFTVLITQVLFLPEDALKVAQSAIWSSISLPNVYFWKFDDTSYFASSSYTIPLLHYWSLGVEEQFYFLWPLIIVLIYKKLTPVAFLLLIVVTILFSASIAEALINSHHSLVYYMLPTRSGELLVGSLLAALIHFNFIKKTENANALFMTSVVALIASTIIIDKDSRFPGFLYLFPTIAAAIYIWSGFNNNSKFTQIINNRAFLWIGKVSFSAYLVHWPVLAIVRYGYGTLSPVIEGIIFGAILVLAYLNWRFVEEKFRYQSTAFNKLVIKQAAIPILGACLLCAGVIFTDGYGLRYVDSTYQRQLDEIKNSTKAPNSYDYVCQYWRVERTHLNNNNCVLGEGNKVNVLLWGDSNAAQYIGILDTIAKGQGWAFRNISHAGCPLLFTDVKPFVAASRYDECLESIKVVRGVLEDYNTLIVSSAYFHYLEKDSAFLDYFFDTLKVISKTHDVVVLGNIPIFENFDRNCKAKALKYPFLDCSYVSNNKFISDINEKLSHFADNYSNIYYGTINDWLCKEICSPYYNGKVIYFDRSHLDVNNTRGIDVSESFKNGLKKFILHL